MKRTLLYLCCILIAACNPKEEARHSEPLPRSSRAPAEEELLQADPPPESGGDVTPAVRPAEPVPKGNWPFVGRRAFETRPAVSGTGTPHRVVEINAEGQVFFEYGQQNATAGTTMTGERIAAGPFRRVMKCSFKELGDTRYYIIGRKTIVEVDAAGSPLRSVDCCGNGQVDMVTECPCQGGLFDPGRPQQAD